MYNKELPSGNKEQVPLIVNELLKRNIEFTLMVNNNGKSFWIIRDDQHAKLPFDDRGMYLPVGEEDGHSFD